MYADLIKSMRLLRNSGDKFSIEAARLSDGNEKEYSYTIKTRQIVSNKLARIKYIVGPSVLTIQMK